MKKTLGGDRLGAGKKIQVDLHGYERSTHDLGYIWRSTMASGTLVPFMSEVALPGDTFDINLDCDIKTHPTLGPLFGSYKVQLDVFQAPIRLYNAMLHNNQLGIGMKMNTVLLPQIELNQPIYLPEETTATSQINPSCILNYLGITGIGIATGGEEDVKREFNSIPLIAYWDIYKNYYANKQEEIGVVIHLGNPPNEGITSITINGETIGTAPIVNPVLGQNVVINFEGNTPYPDQVIVLTSIGPRPLENFVGDWTETTGQLTAEWQYLSNITINEWVPLPVPEPDGKALLSTFPLSNIDDLRTAILQKTSTTVFKIDKTTQAPYGYLCDKTSGVNNTTSTQEGLAIKTYQSDLFNNWLQTEWIDGPSGIAEITSISTADGDKFTLDTLNLAKKVYDMLNRIAVSGGSYDDWLDAVYTHERYSRASTPMYMGGLSKELIFQEVVSNTGVEDEPLGTLAGKGVLGKKHKGGHVTIKVDEPSYILGIVSLTPRVDYSQGNKWDVHLKTMDDLHKPALDQIGFQELITEQMAWWDTNWDDTTETWIQKSAGKQPAWINYMTNVNRTYGNFAIPDNEMFMTLNRRYEVGNDGVTTNIKDLTTYIDPSKFNFIFAETNIDSQNFWTQIAIDITARRKMSAKVMPNL